MTKEAFERARQLQQCQRQLDERKRKASSIYGFNDCASDCKAFVEEVVKQGLLDSFKGILLANLAKDQKDLDNHIEQL